jgi:hypothetical protein
MSNVDGDIVCIQSCVRGFLQRQRYRQLTSKPRTNDAAARIIQKSFRGYRSRKVLSNYKQRLHMQTHCFLQQIEFVNHDFYTRHVRTNYCVTRKSIDSLCHSPLTDHQFKPLVKTCFLMPTPLPLPSLFANAPNVNETCRATVQTSAVRLHARRSTSPLPSTSKFAQVREMFARAQPTGLSCSIPTKTSLPSVNLSAVVVPSTEIVECTSPKATTVLHAVQEYQRQHIRIHSMASKRFTPVCTNNRIHGQRAMPFVAFRARSQTSSNLLSTPSLSLSKQPSKSIAQVNMTMQCS